MSLSNSPDPTIREAVVRPDLGKAVGDIRRKGLLTACWTAFYGDPAANRQVASAARSARRSASMDVE